MSRELIAGILEIDPEDLLPLTGGVVSVVVALEGPEGEKLVAKLTKAAPATIAEAAGPFFQRDLQRLLLPAPDTHHVDYMLLKLLFERGRCLVPQIIEYRQEHRLTLMGDFRQRDFVMLQDMLVDNRMSTEHGSLVGRNLAVLVGEMQTIGDFPEAVVPAERAEDQIEERTDELRATLGYDGEFRDRVQAIIARLHGDGTTLVATDTHPKNMAVKGDGEVLFYDFGRTIYADPQFTLPNFAAHIGLSVLSGCMSVDDGIAFLEQLVAAYNKQAIVEKVDPVDDATFVEYFLCELLHRGKGARWIDPKIYRSTDRFSGTQIKDFVAVAVEYLSKELLRVDRKILTIAMLFESIKEYRKMITGGDFDLNSKKKARLYE